jgi:hypothetical protein
MPDEKDKKGVDQKISEAQRFRYIGFEVFPGKPKDLFKSEQEKSKLVETVVAKRSKGDIIRQECTLLEERVSTRDRFVLAFAGLLILATLFVPWYAAYNEIVQEARQETTQLIPSDTTLSGAGKTDTALGIAGNDSATAPAPPADQQQEGASTIAAERSGSEEIIRGTISRKKIFREYSRLSGIGSILTLGSVGSRIFSSGFVLILTGIIFLVYTLLCVALPIYTLYGIFGVKGDPDERALKLKKILRLSWIPVVLFVLALIISFFGADYSFDASTFYTSLGAGYSVGVFLSSLSWGIIVSLCAFILIAAKGIEI